MTDVLTYRPDPSEFAWTFGGAPPIRTVKPGDILELWTEDAFGGKVRTPEDHVTRVTDPRFLNPQTGPFFVEGAETGDTLAIHFIDRAIARLGMLVHRAAVRLALGNDADRVAARSAA